MSDLSGNYGRQPTVLDSGLPYPKPIEEEYISGEESKKEELELKKEKLKKESGYKREEQPKKEKKEKKKKKSRNEKDVEMQNDGYIRRSSIQSWFNTFMIMNIPIIGWIYLLILALKRNSDQRKDFARAYLVYKLVFFLVALGILIVLMYGGMEIVDRLLRYMNML